MKLDYNFFKVGKLNESKNRQSNNTYYVLDLPSLPREFSEGSRVSEL